MVTNLARASYRLKHSLLRRAAGEHHLDTRTLLTAFSSEWGLNSSEVSILGMRAEQWEAVLQVKSRKPPIRRGSDEAH